MSVVASPRPAPTWVPAPPRTPTSARMHAFQRRPLVYAAMVVYTAVSIGLMAVHSVGLTSEHAILMAILAFSLVARARAFIWDWLPFLFVAAMFEDLTSVSAVVAGTVNAAAPIVLERSLLGGAVATTWLQTHLGAGHLVDALDALLTSE